MSLLSRNNFKNHSRSAPVVLVIVNFEIHETSVRHILLEVDWGVKGWVRGSTLASIWLIAIKLRGPGFSLQCYEIWDR